MDILSILKNFFKPAPPDPGALLSDPSLLEELPKHELFAGAAEMIPVDWTKLVPPFRYQGPSYWCTAFAGTSIAYMFEKKQNGSSPLFSPLELFYRTGGSPAGNYLLNTAHGMEKSLVLEDDVRTPLPDHWDVNQFLKYRAIADATDQMIEFGKRFRLGPAATVKTDTASLRAALRVSPLYIAIGIGKGYFDKLAPRQTSYSAYHAVVLTAIEADGTFKIFDSLTQHSDFDGFHNLAPNYEILMALSFIDIPENWKDVQDIPGALQSYGKHRVLALEQQQAELLKDALRFHPTLMSGIGRDWTLCVCALAYGDYTMTDILNQYTNIRRTNRPIFNLNRTRWNQ